MEREKELPYWLGFSLVNGIGPNRLRRLLDYFNDIEAAWSGTPREWEAAGLDVRSRESLLSARLNFDLPEIVRTVARSGAQVFTWSDREYPALLRAIDDSPPVLYYLGDYITPDEWAVAVVGTRNVSSYGREVTEQLAGSLAHQGITIVSGLALGVDTIAHRAAIAAGGRTIAVLGSGLDHIYPYENRQLALEIARHGAVITDYPFGTKPEPSRFPPRNRIISGLSLGTLIVEAGQRSGALITKNYALEQGREVFAVPGSIFNTQSEGTNAMIQRGEAKLVTSAGSIIEELHLEMIDARSESQEILPDNEIERKIINLLNKVAEPAHIDEIGRTAGLPSADVAGALTMMELKGLVRQVGALNYVKK